MTRWIVEREEQAWALVAQSLSQGGDALNDDRVVFQGWPELVVKTDPGNGLVTPEMARAHLRLQQAVYRGFALLKYGVADIRRLTGEERYSLKLHLAVESGSSIFKVQLSPALNRFFQTALGKMTGGQAMCTVITLGLIICSPVPYGMWLYSQGEIHNERIRVEAQLALADRQAAVEIRRREIEAQGQREAMAEMRAISDNAVTQMQLLRAAYERSEVVRYAATDYIPWRPALLEVALHTGTITINNGVKLDAVVAKKMAKIAKANARVANADRKKAAMKSPAIVEARWVTTVTRGPGLMPPPMRLGHSATI